MDNRETMKLAINTYRWFGLLYFSSKRYKRFIIEPIHSIICLIFILLASLLFSKTWIDGKNGLLNNDKALLIFLLNLTKGFSEFNEFLYFNIDLKIKKDFFHSNIILYSFEVMKIFVIYYYSDY